MVVANIIIGSSSPSEEFNGKALDSWWLQWFNQASTVLFANQQSGTTVNRPIKNLWIGRRYYDTTLSKPVYIYQVTPSVVWKDAAGTTV